MKKRKYQNKIARSMNEKTYEFEKIINKMVIDGKVHFLIKWKGYSMSSNTWEPFEHLSAIYNEIDLWQKQHNKKTKRQNKKQISLISSDEQKPKRIKKKTRQDQKQKSSQEDQNKQESGQKEEQSQHKVSQQESEQQRSQKQQLSQSHKRQSQQQLQQEQDQKSQQQLVQQQKSQKEDEDGQILSGKKTQDSRTKRVRERNQKRNKNQNQLDQIKKTIIKKQSSKKKIKKKSRKIPLRSSTKEKTPMKKRRRKRKRNILSFSRNKKKLQTSKDKQDYNLEEENLMLGQSKKCKVRNQDNGLFKIQENLSINPQHQISQGLFTNKSKKDITPVRTDEISKQIAIDSICKNKQNNLNENFEEQKDRGIGNFQSEKIIDTHSLVTGRLPRLCCILQMSFWSGRKCFKVLLQDSKQIRYITHVNLKDFYPRLLCEYYESKIIEI